MGGVLVHDLACWIYSRRDLLGFRLCDKNGTFRIHAGPFDKITFDFNTIEVIRQIEFGNMYISLDIDGHLL